MRFIMIFSVIYFYVVMLTGCILYSEEPVTIQDRIQHTIENGLMFKSNTTAKVMANFETEKTFIEYGD